MSFPVENVANCFLERNFSSGLVTISPMKLQKLLYCLHGWYLAIKDAPVIDEDFKAWPYGPVEEGLYRIFKPFRNRPINSYAQSQGKNGQEALIVAKVNKEFYDIFNFVCEKYMPFTAESLSALTHQPGTPWSQARDKGMDDIPNDWIKNHFRQLVSS